MSAATVPVPGTPRSVSTASTVLRSGQPRKGARAVVAASTKTRRRTKRPWPSKASNTGRPLDPGPKQVRAVLAHGSISAAVIGLQHQEVVGALGADPLGDLRLAAHRVERHDAAIEVQGLEQRRDRTDLIRLAVDRTLAESQLLPARPGA